MKFQYLDVNTIEVYFEDSGRFMKFYSSEGKPEEIMLNVIFRNTLKPTMKQFIESLEITQVGMAA